MKKTIIALTLLAILAVLVACSSKTNNTASTTGNSASLSGEAQLLVGTFKLEDTGLAVTADQATQLLPLWQTLQSLSSSNTAATEEINAVVDQIKGTMTAQQMAKITAMNLSQADVISIMSQAGVSPNGASTSTTRMPGNGFPSGAGPQGGAGEPPSGSGPGGPGGAPPSGGFPGGGDPGVGGVAGGVSATPQANRPAAMGSQVPPPLLNALIQILQKKIG